MREFEVSIDQATPTVEGSIERPWLFGYRLEMLQHFQEAFPDRPPEVVYYPCSFTDATPSAAFPDSRRVIYVDIRDRPVRVLIGAGKEAYRASAEEFLPDEPVDLLVLKGMPARPDQALGTVTWGGYVLADEGYDVADEVNRHPDFRLAGLIHYERATGGIWRVPPDELLTLPPPSRSYRSLSVFQRRAVCPVG